MTGNSYLIGKGSLPTNNPVASRFQGCECIAMLRQLRALAIYDFIHFPEPQLAERERRRLRLLPRCVYRPQPWIDRDPYDRALRVAINVQAVLSRPWQFRIRPSPRRSAEPGGPRTSNCLSWRARSARSRVQIPCAVSPQSRLVKRRSGQACRPARAKSARCSCGAF